MDKESMEKIEVAAIHLQVSVTELVAEIIRLQQVSRTLQKHLKECIDSSAAYMDAVDTARRCYHNSTLWYLDGHQAEIDAAEQRFLTVQQEVEVEQLLLGV